MYGFILIGRVSLTHSHAGFIFVWGVSLTHPMLASFLSGEFLLHIPCWIYFSVGSFSYTSRVGFLFCGVSLRHPALVSFFFFFFFFFFFYLGSFSYTSRVGFNFIWGVSLTHPMLALVWSEDLFLHIPCCFIFMQGICLTHPMLPSFLWREFVWHIPRCLHFYAGTFSDTSQATFNCLHFYVGSFCYTSHAGFFLSGEFLLYNPSWLLFYVLHIPCWLFFFFFL